LKFAYADPVYLGQGKRYLPFHPEAMIWDDPETHRRLIQRLCDEYQEGWALSASSPSLYTLLPMCPAGVRVSPWIKPFASYKPNVNPGYVWEPVLWIGGRRYERQDPTVRDFHVENITLKKGLPGAKPPRFASWILGLLGVDFERSDAIDDIFPGTHGMTVIFNERRARAQRLQDEAFQAFELTA
jgi:hypothetical protein